MNRGRGIGDVEKNTLRLEAEAAAADPVDLAEALLVRAEMDALAAPLTEV